MVDSEPGYYRCANWNSTTWDKKGVRVYFFRFRLQRTRKRNNVPADTCRRGKALSVHFCGFGGCLCQLDKRTGRQRPTLQSVTPAGSTIDFFADGTAPIIPVRGGRLVGPQILEDLYIAKTYSVECARGDSGKTGGGRRRKKAGDKLAKRPGPVSKLRGDVFADKRRYRPARAPEPETPAGELAKSMEKTPSRSGTETRLKDIFAPARKQTRV